MNGPAHVSWRARLLLSFAVLIPTLLAMILFVVIRDYIHVTHDVRWGNGGEEQMVGVTAIYGSLGALFTYGVFIVPLVLLWLVQSQLKHWYFLMLAALMWLPLSLPIVSNARPVDMLHDLLHPFHRDLVWLLEPFAFLACGLYLILLHGFDRRGRH